MSFIPLDHDTLIQKIRQDPRTAIAKQTAVPAEATNAMLRIARKLFGIFDRQDHLEFSAELIRTMRYIAEHDYLAYLSITKRFDLIRELFWDKRLFAKQLALVKQLEKRQRAKWHRRDFLFAEEERLSLDKKHQQELIDQEQRLAENRRLIIEVLHGYFKLLRQTIYNEFFVKQIIIYEEAYKLQMARMRLIKALIRQDVFISDADKQKFDNLVNHYAKEWNSISKISIHNTDGTLNYDQCLYKYNKTQALYHHFNQSFIQLTSQYTHNPQLQQLCQEQMLASIQFEAKLATNIRIRNEKLAEIEPHIDLVSSNFREEKLKLMDKCIELLEALDAYKLSSHESAGFEKTGSELKHYRNTLRLPEYHKEISELSKKFIRELNKYKDHPELTPEGHDLISYLAEMIQPGVQTIELQHKPQSQTSNQLFFKHHEENIPPANPNNIEIHNQPSKGFRNTLE